MLEGRRLASDGFMWQAPALTLVAQAFLLRILADDTLKEDPTLATAIAVAGALATSAAALALWLLGNRERFFSTRVSDTAKDLTITRAITRPPAEGTLRKLSPMELKGSVVWSVVLLSFSVVDGMVLGARHGGCAVF